MENCVKEDLYKYLRSSVCRSALMWLTLGGK